jgi:hypothetical protein
MHSHQQQLSALPPFGKFYFFFQLVADKTAIALRQKIAISLKGQSEMFTVIVI